MIEARHIRYYAFVWPLFWPVLWLNLRRLVAWQKQTGRAVLLRVDRYGNLSIEAVADAPRPGLYRYTPPAVPAWQQPERWSDLPESLAGEALTDLASIARASGMTERPGFAGPHMLHDTS